MLSLLVLFIYLYVITALSGAAVIALISRILKTGPEYHDFGLVSYCMTGLAFCAVYAQYASLFAGLAHIRVQVPLWIISAAGCFRLFRQHTGSPSDLHSVLKRNRKCIILAVVMTVLFAYGASRGILHTDTGLYHAQSIRWSEVYGTVPGLANLHLRLGYNSAAFPLTALFSFPYLTGGRSLHGTGAFMALLLSLECLTMFPVFRQDSRDGKVFRLSDFCRLAALYYLFTIFDEMISPASDYFLCIGVFYLMIRFLSYAESGREKELLPYCLLSLFGVFLVSVKLSAVMIILLSFYTLYLIIRCSGVKKAACCRIGVMLLTGFLVILPFLLRNIVLTGYLIYPFPQIDLFAFDFKVPWGEAMYDQREISVWGRGYTDVRQYSMPVREWFPGWFSALDSLHRILFGFDAAAVVIIPVLLLAGRIKKLYIWAAYSVLTVSFVYWFTSSPLIRYGCVYVYMMAAFAAGTAAVTVFTRTPAGESPALSGRYGYIFMILAVLFTVYKGVMLVREEKPLLTQPYWVWQEDYGEYDVIPYDIGGITFYYAEDGGATGYYAFPSSPQPAAEMELRGSTLKEGFRKKQTR